MLGAREEANLNGLFTEEQYESAKRSVVQVIFYNSLTGQVQTPCTAAIAEYEGVTGIVSAYHCQGEGIYLESIKPNKILIRQPQFEDRPNTDQEVINITDLYMNSDTDFIFAATNNLPESLSRAALPVVEGIELTEALPVLALGYPQGFYDRDSNTQLLQAWAGFPEPISTEIKKLQLKGMLTSEGISGAPVLMLLNGELTIIQVIDSTTDPTGSANSNPIPAVTTHVPIATPVP